ncbi:hypothetical protein [Brevundimonas goettingensis]|uniref:Uncharacterized protein n=1 Tax=Brevundimonas goettingensis TaxID=2774190 RepID=A0A975C2K7_9CAUL|nr:hypothetical protein [Brevundimonas goettingensis]QTC92718.1 hypothetical protein IFJ75_07625 [Brevundimonas goettingensis]
MSKTDPKSPKALQGSGVAFMGAGAAFMAIGATNHKLLAFLGVGGAFLAIGASFLARAKKADKTGEGDK